MCKYNIPIPWADDVTEIPHMYLQRRLKHRVMHSPLRSIINITNVYSMVNAQLKVTLTSAHLDIHYVVKSHIHMTKCTHIYTGFVAFRLYSKLSRPIFQISRPAFVEICVV
jgi:hypothetical protein